MKASLHEVRLYALVVLLVCAFLGQLPVAAAEPPPETGQDVQAEPPPAEPPPADPPPEEVPPEEVPDEQPPPEPPPLPPPPADENGLGSNSYSWDIGRSSPIGVYANSATPIGSYEIVLEYDSNMLRYVSGAAERNGNQLVIRGSGESTSHRTMVYFEPLREGNTTIRVISAIVRTVADSEGIDSEIAVDVSGTAPIRINRAASISKHLEELFISPAGIDFSSDVFQYDIFVEADVEELMIGYVAYDDRAVVTVSDTALAVGENIITITVEGNEDDPVVYTLLVTRAEPEPEPVPTPTPVPEEPDYIEASSFEPEEATLSLLETEVVPRLYYFSWKIILGFFVVFIICAMIVWRLYDSIWRKSATHSGNTKAIPHDDNENDDIKIINLDEIVIDVRNVSMEFKMATVEASSLKEYVIRIVKGLTEYRVLRALQKIDFMVHQGDVVGIIGTNGSGKSTLLKIISGALKPTSGSVKVDKRKIQMLTLGTGFDMELTGKENVYLNGAIIGYTKEFIDEKYDDIVAFAELEHFMDERMKNYSSGMVSRLAFAIATVKDAPEILILDEVLAVGDIAFKNKSMKRIKKMIHGGSTVLIVSHTMETIISNCNKAVWIEKGKMKMIGRPQKVCKAYEAVIGGVSK